MKKVEVEWRDSHSVVGWFSEGDIDESDHINTSIGYLVKDTNDYIILTFSHYPDEDVYGDLLYIIRQDVVSIRSLD